MELGYILGGVFYKTLYKIMEQGLYNGVKINFIALSSELSYDERHYLVYFNNSLWRARQTIKMSTLEKGDIIVTDKVVDASIPEYDKLLENGKKI